MATLVFHKLLWSGGCGHRAWKHSCWVSVSDSLALYLNDQRHSQVALTWAQGHTRVVLATEDHRVLRMEIRRSHFSDEYNLSVFIDGSVSYLLFSCDLSVSAVTSEDSKPCQGLPGAFCSLEGGCLQDKT